MPVADQVIVRKSERRLYLMRHGEVLRSYRVALGLNPDGPKERAGDFRTPEGHYQLTRRNPRSDYFLSIQVSYPNDRGPAPRAAHTSRSGRLDHDPRPAEQSARIRPILRQVRTGPMAVSRMSDSDMVEIWLMTQDNTPIDILP